MYKRNIKMFAVMLTIFACNGHPTSLTSELNEQQILVKNENQRIREEEKEVKEFVSIFAESVLDEYEIVTDPEIEDDTVKEEKYITLDVVVSYYTSLPEENGVNYGGRNAVGGYLSSTSIAIPRNGIIKYGMTVEFESLGETYMKDYNGQYLTRIADDCGSPKHIRVREDGVYRMDIYCPKFSYESDEQYKARVNNYGKYRTTCKVYTK